jgi:hypothetical protein
MAFRNMILPHKDSRDREIVGPWILPTRTKSPNFPVQSIGPNNILIRLFGPTLALGNSALFAEDIRLIGMIGYARVQSRYLPWSLKKSSIVAIVLVRLIDSDEGIRQMRSVEIGDGKIDINTDNIGAKTPIFRFFFMALAIFKRLGQLGSLRA